MSTTASVSAALANGVTVTDDELIVRLADGRTLTVPVLWFPRLAAGSREQRNNWELLGNGEGIHWPDLDEDLSVAGLLGGSRPLSALTSSAT